MTDNYIPTISNFYSCDAFDCTVVPKLRSEIQYDLGNYVTGFSIKETSDSKTLTLSFYESEDNLNFLNAIPALEFYNIRILQLDNVGGTEVFTRINNKCKWQCNEFRTMPNNLCTRDVTFEVLQ